MANDEVTTEVGRRLERARVSSWLKAKAVETRQLLERAAAAGDPDEHLYRMRHAQQTQAIIGVLAIMVERDELSGATLGAP